MLQSTASAKGIRKDAFTPVMRQLLGAKELYPDAFIFFRLGDFYELFFDDAVRAAPLLEIALTSRGTDPRGEKIPMAGVPHHALSNYLGKLLRAGHKVAICEQMADPASVKGVVPRQVVRVVTPGLCLDEENLDAQRNNYLVAVSAERGLAALEFSTCVLRMCVLESEASLIAEIMRLAPSEIVIDENMESIRVALEELLPDVPVRKSNPKKSGAQDTLLKTLGDQHSALARLGEGSPAVCAARLAMHYAVTSQPLTAVRVQRVEIYDPGERLLLDEAAIRNLELVRSLDGGKVGSLLGVLDQTRTSMGARRMRENLVTPLRDIAAIQRRLDIVETLVEELSLREELEEILRRIPDLERLTTRALMDLATPRDLGTLRSGLVAVRELGNLCQQFQRSRAKVAAWPWNFEDFPEAILQRLVRALVEAPPILDKQGGIFADAVNPELDELRCLANKSKDLILAIEKRERERTGINSLKVKFTKVFGYYIEITRSNLDAVPVEYLRKQTVANAERFTTSELSELESKVLTADERASALEHELFRQLRREVAEVAPQLLKLADVVAQIDVSQSLAHVAHRRSYTKPAIDESVSIELHEARHPTVEALIESGTFVPNDVVLDCASTRLITLTGPNMAGKSTLMRQCALAVILAQMGSFVPAKKARIGLCDRIFTRVGASDNLSRGQSTFMVEMREAANILCGATRQSLVIVDEVGRGTSTYDGLAIAWAMVEYLHNTIECRTIFATHYHELCELTEALAHAKNFNVSAKKIDGRMVFLHKLQAGAANRSYGIEVARAAGLPDVVVSRARAVLQGLEATKNSTPT